MHGDKEKNVSTYNTARDLHTDSSRIIVLMNTEGNMVVHLKGRKKTKLLTLEC